MKATTTRLTSTGAGAKKYDVLSTLALAGLENAALPSQRALRLIALITIRYNWAADMLCVGHAELGRLWKVSKRTVIREMDALRGLGVLVVLRPGRRGSVTTYRIDIAAIRRLAAASIPDDATGIKDRLAAHAEGGGTERCGPTPEQGASAPQRKPERDLWDAILDRLPDTVSSAQKERWLVPMRPERRRETLRVEADSAFRADYIVRTFSDALQIAARPLGVTRVAIVVADPRSSAMGHGYTSGRP